MISYEGDEEIIIVPSEIDGLKVSKIASTCFFCLDKVKEIHFPEGVIIGNNAVVACENLQTVYIPSVLKIGSFLEDCENANIIVSDSSIGKKINKANKENTLLDLSVFKTIVKSDGTLEISTITTGYSKKNLCNLVIPDYIDGRKVTSLGKALFSKKYFNKVSLNKFIKEIPEYCFNETVVKTIENLENITAVNSKAFFSARILEPLNLVNLETVGVYAFFDCYADINIGNSLKNISTGAFNNSGISYVSLENIIELPKECFKNSENLRSVTLSKKTTIIPESCFSGCTNLEEVGNLKKIKEFKDRAFEGCSSMIFNINFSKVTHVGIRAFSECSLPKTIKIGNCELNEYSFAQIKNTSKVVFEEQFAGSFIPEGCFMSSDIKKVVLSENINKICSSAFKFCKNLTSINMENVKTVYSDILYRTKVKELHLDSLEESSSSSFQSMQSLTFVDLSKSSIKNIRRYMFYACFALKSILLPDTVESIESQALAMTALKEISLPKNLKNLGELVFSSTRISNLTFPENFEMLEGNTFGGLKSILTIKFLSKNVKIGKNCFIGINVDILDLSYLNFTEIPNNAFYQIKANTIKLPDGIKRIGKFAFAHSHIKNLIFNTENVEIIEDCAFHYSVLPDFGYIETAKVYKKDCYYCFKGKSKELTIKNATLIEASAFDRLDNLKELTILGEPSLGRDNFECCSIKKITAKSKVVSKLKSRAYFKQRTIQFEKVK